MNSFKKKELTFTKYRIAKHELYSKLRQALIDSSIRDSQQFTSEFYFILIKIKSQRTYMDVLLVRLNLDMNWKKGPHLLSTSIPEWLLSFVSYVTWHGYSYSAFYWTFYPTMDSWKGFCKCRTCEELSSVIECAH